MNIPEITTDELYEDIYKTIDKTNYLSLIRPFRGLNIKIIKDDIIRLTKLLSNISHRFNSGEVDLFEVHHYLVTIINLLFINYSYLDIRPINIISKNNIVLNIRDYSEIPYYDYKNNIFTSKQPMYNIGDKIISCLYEGEIINIK